MSCDIFNFMPILGSDTPQLLPSKVGTVGTVNDVIFPYMMAQHYAYGATLHILQLLMAALTRDNSCIATITKGQKMAIFDYSPY